jgi:hypothetical protein
MAPDCRKITAIVLAQMLMEDAVAQSPPPSVKVTRPQFGVGVVQIDIGYTDATTAAPVALGFSVAV